MDMNNFVHGGIINITAGDGISINTTMNGASPEYPQIIATGQPDGLLYVTTDNTLTGDGTPQNPLHVVDDGAIKDIVANSPNVHITASGATRYIAVDSGGGDYWEPTGSTSLHPIAPYNAIRADNIQTQNLTMPATVDGLMADIEQIDIKKYYQ
jgi:hypothetical protein